MNNPYEGPALDLAAARLATLQLASQSTCLVAARLQSGSGAVLIMIGAVESDTEVQSNPDAMLQNIVTSSAIEGESS